MSWPKYAEVSDSGVGWLGNTPATWTIGPLKRWIESIESGTSVNAVDIPAGNSEIGVLKTSCVYTGKFDITKNKTVVPEELDTVSCPLREGTLIVSRMNTPDLVGAAGYVNTARPGIYLPDRLWQVSFRALSPRWVAYWSRTSIYRDQLKTMSVGTSSSMHNISQADFGSIIIPVPYMNEQKSIIDFLDRETAKIDGLIFKHEQLIATLREDRTATITHAVSRGLDSDSKPEPAADVWSDAAPRHWKVVPLKHLVQMQSGVNITAESIEPSGEYAVYGGNGVRGYTSRPTHRGEFILIGRQGALCGNVHHVRGEFWASEHAIVCTPRIELSVGWLSNLMEAMSLGQYSQAAAQPGISADVLGNLRVAVPPVPEQCRMAAMLETSEKRFNALVGKSSEIIRTLLEFRSALITDAVTGKIDVRGVA